MLIGLLVGCTTFASFRLGEGRAPLKGFSIDRVAGTRDRAADGGRRIAGEGDAAAGVDGSDMDSVGEDGDATSGDGSDSVGTAGGDDGTVDGVLGDSSGKISGDEDAALDDDDGADVSKVCRVDGSTGMVGSSTVDECLTGVVGLVGVAGLTGVAGSTMVVGLTCVENPTGEECRRADSTGISRFEESGDSTGNRCSTEDEGRDEEAPGVGCGFSTGVMLPAIAPVSKSLVVSPIMIFDPVPLESPVTRWT